MNENKVLSEDRLEQLTTRLDRMVTLRQANADETDMLVALRELADLRQTICNAYLALIDTGASVGIINVSLTDAIEIAFESEVEE